MHLFEQAYSNKEQTSSCSCAKCISNIIMYIFLLFTKASNYKKQEKSLEKTMSACIRYSTMLSLN